MPTKAEAQKTRILDAFLARLATMPVNDIRLEEVAADAGVSLQDLRANYDGRVDLIAAFNRRVDLETLARHDPALSEEPARDRLFDVVMARLDVLSPWREAVRMLDRSVRRDPMLALAVAPGVIRSMDFMLASAGIPTGGPRGRLRARGLALAWSRIVPVWLDDHDPGLARTLVAVDRELGRCAMAERMIDRLEGIACALPGVRRRDRRRPREEDLTAGEGI